MSKTPREQRGLARTQLPERTQVEMRLLALDEWLDAEHRVRVVWQYAEALDLSPLYASIKATADNVGRSPIDPRIMFALWLFATLEGVSSARRLAELCTRDIPYLWLCGGVTVNYHTLADFRDEQGAFLEQLLTDSIAVLLHEGLVTLNTVAQDGMRVRASAGSAAHVDELRRQQEQDESDGDGGQRRRQAAQARAAREKLERIMAAQENLQEMPANYDKRSGTPRSQPRASTTDPDR